MSQPWVATVRNKPRTYENLPKHPAYQNTKLLPEAPALGRIIQTAKGGRVSN